MMPVCSFPGCESTTTFRVSPKGPGSPYVGRCRNHLPDDFVMEPTIKRIVETFEPPQKDDEPGD